MISDELFVSIAVTSATLSSSPDARIAARHDSGQRVAWQGTVGEKAHCLVSGRTRAHLCLTDMTDDNGVRVFARVWLPLGVSLNALGPESGGTVAFVAGVEKLLDGTYRLARASQFRWVETSG